MLLRQPEEPVFVSARGTDFGTRYGDPHTDQWREREYNFGGDAEGIKEQLQGIRKTISFLLDNSVGVIDSVVSACEVYAKATEL